jgi:protocatechuate 3,4-dioxygenase beta subunit
MDPKVPSSPLHRRDLMRAAAALGLTAVPILACAEKRASAPAEGRLIAGATCPVTPRQTEGPFYFDPRLVREDVTEGKAGVPLRLRLQIVEAEGCARVERARVDIWHCDARGAYSGYDEERSAGETWLRGTQLADADGIAEFRTIYPGWYEGRTPHVHLKARLPDGREIVSQIYFPDALSDRVYAERPYAGRSGRRLRNGDDGIFRSLGAKAPVAEITAAAEGYDASIIIALS